MENSPNFVQLPSAIWRLRRDEIPADRHEHLTVGAYEGTVDEIARTLRVTSHRRNRSKDGEYYRAIVTLTTSTPAVDQFHNAAFGYRAQYYESVETGEQANGLAVERFAAAILASDVRWKRTISHTWLEPSLFGFDSKVWIYQGLWLRYKRGKDRNLTVERWEGNRTSSRFEKSDRKVTWASLTPASECRLQFKSTFVRLDGKPIGESKKPLRGNEIHELGFT